MSSSRFHKTPIQGSLGNSIPGIDAALLTGTDDDRRIAAGQIRAACLETGFFCIDKLLTESTNHQKLLSQMRRFFDLPDDDSHKMAIDVTGKENTYGWMPMFQEPSYQPGTIAHLESFDCGRAPRKGEKQSPTASAWPDIPDFRSDIRNAWDELTRFGMATMRAIAEAADLDTEFFAKRCASQDLSTMRLLNYPPSENDSEQAANVGIAAHTDFECITLISQTAPGLELMGVNGQWFDAPASDDRLVVLLGDMLERWTNGMFRATGHRVRCRSWQRYSVVLFFGVNDDVTVAPLESFISADNPARFAPVGQREHSSAMLALATKNRQRPEH